MMEDFKILVGDNAFHGISHLSQERARARGEGILDPRSAAKIVRTSFENGANGFMFSVSETTLAILREMRAAPPQGRLSLFPIVPYAFEYVSRSTRSGGIAGMAKSFLFETLSSGHVGAVARSARGYLLTDPRSLLDAYLTYELARVRSAAGPKAKVVSLLLHEVVTDMALALEFRWLFETHLDFSRRHGMRAGFETRNFALLVDKLTSWDFPLKEVTIAAPFNRIGFLMTPSREECERAAWGADGAEVIAMSVLAAGYLKLQDAAAYVAGLSGLTGVVAGVSQEDQAAQTFCLLKKKLVLTPLRAERGPI